MHVSSCFDSGAVQVVDLSDPARLRLRLRPDSAADIRQWFHFRLQGARGVACRLRLEDADLAAFPDGWQGYRAVASYDRRAWFRVPAHFDGQALVIEHTPEADSVYYAYFEPYSGERHLDLLGRACLHARTRVERLGATAGGRDLDLVTVGEPASGKRKVWVIARQHPGESMAEWFAEGLLERLWDETDPVARAVLDKAVLFVVPNMNPDGAALGNLRTNAAGRNLNREWLSPSLAASPEVWHVRRAMEATGVDLFLDIHGDEGLPYVFTDGCDMLPSFTPAQAKREAAFLARFLEASPDFQTRCGYARDRFTDELLTLASKWVGHTFGCLSLTLEMPFKDNADRPDPVVGWNGLRSKALGAAVLEPILQDL